MNYKFRHIAFAILTCLAVLSTSCNGSLPTTPIDGPLGQRVTEIDPRIWVIYQASNGDFWFGSNGNGAYRFDGEVVTHYTSEDGLTGTQVRDIQGDNKGNIFISTNSGVFKFDGTAFTLLKITKATSPDDGWTLDADDVWIVYQPGENGPLRYDGENLYMLQLSKSPAEDAVVAQYPQTDFSHSGVTSIYKDRRGHVWFGTSSVGLCRFDGQTLSWMYEEHLTTTPSGGSFGIRSIYEDRAGHFWICNTRNRFQVSPESVLADGYNLIKYEKETGLPDAAINADTNFNYFPSMTQDQAGALWMACGSDGVWKYDGKNVTRYTLDDDAYALKIYCDNLGMIWVGTLESGLFQFNESGFEPFGAP